METLFSNFYYFKFELGHSSAQSEKKTNQGFGEGSPPAQTKHSQFMRDNPKLAISINTKTNNNIFNYTVQILKFV